MHNLFYLSWPALVSGPGGVSGPEPCGKLDFWVRLDVSINNFMVEHRWEWRQLLSTLSRGRYIETRHWKLQVRLHRRQNFTFWDIRNFIFVEKEESTPGSRHTCMLMDHKPYIVSSVPLRNDIQPGGILNQNIIGPIMLRRIAKEV